MFIRVSVAAESSTPTRNAPQSWSRRATRSQHAGIISAIVKCSVIVGWKSFLNVRAQKTAMDAPAMSGVV